MRQAHLESRAPTRCETVLYGLMDDVFGAGNWERQHPVRHWTVDAAVPTMRLVVQADGEYWHGHLPDSADHPQIRKNVANDRRQDRWLEQNGWTLLRLREVTLLKHPEDARSQLVAIVHKRAKGEWFLLTRKDVAAFKRRRYFM